MHLEASSSWFKRSVCPVGDVGCDGLVLGSGGLSQTLMQHRLVDEYLLWLHPVVLGTGKRLFTDGGRMTGLELADARTTTNGLVILTYDAAGD